MELLALGNCN